MEMLKKQLDASEKHRSEYMKRYDEAISEKKKLSDDFLKRISDLQSSRSSLDDRCSSLLKTLESTKQEASNWKRKHDQLLSKQKADEDQTSSGI